MAFSVSEFRNHFSRHNEFAKTSKFDVFVTAPPGLGMSAADLRFQCETTELPGYTVNTVDGRYYGVANPVASFPTYADLTLTFVCAGDFWEKKFFDRWMNLVIPFNNYNPNYKDNYTAPKIEINQYSEVASGDSAGGAGPSGTAGVNFGETTSIVTPSSAGSASTAVTAPIIYKVSFFGAFPTSIAPMNVNWGDDGIHRLAVTFRYEYWITGDLESMANPMPSTPPTQPKPEQGRGSSSGSTPPVQQPVPAPPGRTTVPPPIKPGGGKFAGGGASGRW